jgi:hypothetical protein
VRSKSVSLNFSGIAGVPILPKEGFASTEESPLLLTLLFG